jgi:hypothetical protein
MTDLERHALEEASEHETAVLAEAHAQGGLRFETGFRPMKIIDGHEIQVTAAADGVRLTIDGKPIEVDGEPLELTNEQAWNLGEALRYAATFHESYDFEPKQDHGITP